MSENNLANEIKLWVTEILSNQKLNNLRVNLTGTAEKGDGYIGDVVFVQASGVSTNGTTKNLDLVLKCSKRHEVAQKDPRLVAPFINEMYFYNSVFPTFLQFQQENGVSDPFENVPKFYGTFVEENMKVIALENLKTSGFDLWPRQQPQTRKHLELVLEAYGKYHACSVAMQQKRPEEFEEIARTVNETIKSFQRGIGFQAFKSCINESADLLQNDLDSNILKKWRSLADEVENVIIEFYKMEGLKVIRHGDCWNNNFMFKHNNDDKTQPSEVVILDWQLVKCSSPIFDISYYVFSCISGEDIENLQDILTVYYQHFSAHLEKLGIDNGHEIYSCEQFLADWKQYCKIGIIIATMLLRVCSTDKDDAVDVAESVEEGKEFFEVFTKKISRENEITYKNRIRGIVKYIVENNII